jgi:uncharacterized protein YgiB involved in biofilm formation
MLRKLRKSSGRVTLVLIGVAALAGCGEADQRRDVYKSKEDCLADWANKPQDCTPATEKRHSGLGYWYGPSYPYRSSSSGSSWTNGASRLSSSRSLGSTSSGVSRGGFGSSGHSSGG